MRREAQAEAVAWARTSTGTATCTRLHARAAKELGDTAVKPLQLIPLKEGPLSSSLLPPRARCSSPRAPQVFLCSARFWGCPGCSACRVGTG